MATAIGAVVGWLSSAMGGGALATFVAEVIVAVAVVAGANALSQATTKKPGSNSLLDPGQWTKLQINPLSDRVIVYGETGLAGEIDFQQVHADRKWVSMVIALADAFQPIGHEHIKTLINGDLIEFDGSGNATYGGGSASEVDYTGVMKLRFYGGTPDQTADAQLITDSNYTWTSDHRGRGICYVVWSCMLSNGNKFPSGRPDPIFVLKGRRLYDPRLDSTKPGGSGDHRIDDQTTWEWSNNAALCAYDYARGIFAGATPRRVAGLGLPLDLIDEGWVVASANVCGAEGWTIDGPFEAGSDPAEMLKTFAEHMAGRVATRKGRLSIIAGNDWPSSLTIYEDDLAGAVKIKYAREWRETFNAIKGTYRDATTNYEAVETNLIAVDAWAEEDGGQTFEKAMPFPFTHDQAKATRLAKFWLHRSRAPRRIECAVKLIKSRAIEGDLVDVEFPSYGISETYEVVSWSLDQSGFAQLTLELWDAAGLEWSEGEEGDPPVWSRIDRIPITPPTPDEGDWEVTPTLNTAGGLPLFLVEGTSPDWVTGVEVAFRQDGDSVWIPAGRLPPGVGAMLINGITPSAAYEVSVRYYFGTLYSDRLVIEEAAATTTLFDGRFVVRLTNEAHTVAASSDGTVASFDGAGGSFEVLDGASDITTGHSIVYAVGSETGVDVSINSSTGVYTVSSMSADKGTAVLTATIGALVISRVYSISKSRAGATGSTGSTGATGATGATGDPGADAKIITLTASDHVFRFSSDDTPSPTSQSITLTAALQNLSGDVSWATSPTVTLGGSGNTRTLSVADFGANASVRITISKAGAPDDVLTIYRGRQSADGYGDNIIPDPEMRDAGFWGAGSFSLIDAGGGWPGRRAMQLGAGSHDLFSKYFPVERGATYLISVHIATSADFAGYVQPIIHVPWVRWHSMVNGNSITPETHDGTNGAITAHTHWATYTTLFTNPTGTVGDGHENRAWQFRTLANISAGWAYLNAIKITRVHKMGSTIAAEDGTILVDDDVVTAAGIALGITGQGWGATASESEASNAVVGYGQNRLLYPQWERGFNTGWSFTYRNGSGSWVPATVDLMADGSARVLIPAGAQADAYGAILVVEQINIPHRGGEGVELQFAAHADEDLWLFDYRTYQTKDAQWTSVEWASLGAANNAINSGGAAAGLFGAVGSVYSGWDYVWGALRALHVVGANETLGSNRYVYFLKPMVAGARAGQTVVSPWTPGTQAQPGADKTGENTALTVADQSVLTTYTPPSYANNAAALSAGEPVGKAFWNTTHSRLDTVTAPQPFTVTLAVADDAEVITSPGDATSISFTPTVIGGSGSYTYSWTHLSGDVGSIGSSATASTTITYTFAAPGTNQGFYQLLVRDNVTGQTATCVAYFSGSYSL